MEYKHSHSNIDIQELLPLRIIHELYMLSHHYFFLIVKFYISEIFGGFLSSSLIALFVFLNRSNPFIKIYIPAGIKIQPTISIIRFPKNLINVTPTTAKVRAVRM